MVRAYDRPFLSTLNLRSMGTEINTEILYKALLLGAKVSWRFPLTWTGRSASRAAGGGDRSARLRNSTNGYLLSGFIFRPVLFFIGPGLVVLVAALYTLGWVTYRVSQLLRCSKRAATSARESPMPSMCRTRRLPTVSSSAASR